jgi:tetratricopeptide (TPR) repeat protein
MKGRAVTTLFALCFSTSILFSQIYSTDHDSFPGRSDSINKIQSCTISGVVIGSDGAALPDVRVEIRDEQTSRTVASGYTNNSGAFEFAHLPFAPYDISASRGLIESHQHLALGDLGMNLKIRLASAGAAAAQVDGNATVSVAEYKVPQKARNAFHKAEAALAKNRLDEVAKQLAKALEIYPDYAAALTLRGVTSLDSAHPEAAVNDFDKAIHSDPGYALAYTAMAAAFNQLNKFDDALRSATRAISLSPSSWQSYFEMAKSYVGKADYEHALQQITKAQQMVPKEYPPIHLVRAHVMLALKNYAEAMGELQAFLTLAPQDPNSGAARRALEKVKTLTSSAPSSAMVQAQK